MLRGGGLRPWSWKGPDHGVGVDPETVNKGNHCNERHCRQLKGSAVPLTGPFTAPSGGIRSPMVRAENVP